MEITYSLTPRDLMALDFYVLRRQLMRPRLNINTGSLLFIVLFFTLNNFYLVTQGEPLGIWVLKPIGWLSIYLVAIVGEIVLSRLLALKNNPRLLAPRTEHFGPEGILVQTEGQKTLVRWLNIHKIENFGNHLFLSYETNRAIFLPHSAFFTPEALAEFTAKLQSFHQAALVAGIVEDEATIITPHSGGLEISFILESEDVLALQRIVSRQKTMKPWVSIAIFSVIGLVILGTVITYFYEIWRENQEVFRTLLLFSVGVILVVAAIIGIAFGISKWREHLRKRKAATVPMDRRQKHTIRLDAEGMLHSDITGEVFIPWRTIHAVLEDTERIYLLMTLETGCPIPRRAFATPAEMRQFVQFALSRCRNRGTAEGTDNPW